METTSHSEEFYIESGAVAVLGGKHLLTKQPNMLICLTK
jgi:hypothetical protein